MLRKSGFRDVETASFYDRDSAGSRNLLDQAGLTRSVIRYAKTLGASYILTSGMPHQGEVTEDDVRKAAAAFNEWGAKTKAVGIQFGYHPHGFEFVHTPTQTLFDVLAAETRPIPRLFSNATPTAFNWSTLKDLAKRTPRNRSGSAPDETSVAVSAGVLRWPDNLRGRMRPLRCRSRWSTWSDYASNLSRFLNYNGDQRTQ